ncbi:MAG: DUF4143 domain-containing protein [Acidiferrobacterales bacterium]|nr:DUF4143 domain-containing protein [Acidiferrobacterales bacterium]
MFVKRDLAPVLRAAATQSPVVTLTGPRQSGKTTLVKKLFENHAYVNLEAPDLRASVQNDPRSFLKRYSDGCIVDEVQRVPDLVSYIQTIVDEDPRPGRWILTGSQNLQLSESISQSLAGRTSVFTLFPLTRNEIVQFQHAPSELYETLYCGGYPRIFNESRIPSEWLRNYVQTYLERDVRQLANVGDLDTFQRFVGLCAGRSGTYLNYSSLATDCGISQPTAKSWISLLEASFIVFRLPPFTGNVRKQLIKMPKLYFYDTGLMCWLLGIHEISHIPTHPLFGQIFETWVASEIVKHRANLGTFNRMFVYRDRNGAEVDFVIPQSDKLLLVEAKSSMKPALSLFKQVKRVGTHLEHLPKTIESTVVYGGDHSHEYSGQRLVPWRKLRYPFESVSDAGEYENFALVSISADGQRMPGVNVLALFQNKTWVAATTDSRGIAKFSLHTMTEKMKVYAAVAGYSAELRLDWIPSQNKLDIDLRALPNGGSVIIKSSSGNVPGLSGPIDPFLDAQDHTYFYATNIAVNGGNQQPVNFKINEIVHLADANGNTCNIRFIDITGQSSLLEYFPEKQ